MISGGIHGGYCAWGAVVSGGGGPGGAVLSCGGSPLEGSRTPAGRSRCPGKVPGATFLKTCDSSGIACGSHSTVSTNCKRLK